MPMPDAIRQIHDAADAAYMPFGPADADPPIELVESFGMYEAEYGVIRKGVGVLVMPQRGVVRLSGADVKDFLHRLTTQDIAAMTGGQSRRAFQLNEKGRIVADMLVHHGDLNTWLELDAVDIDTLIATLEAKRFAEDVTIEDARGDLLAIALHGPDAGKLLEAVCDADVEGASTPAAAMEMAGTHHVLSIAEHRLTAARRDDCGVPGAHLLIPTDAATDVYQKLIDTLGGIDPDVEGGAKREITGRGIGWLAYNTARIEAGTAIYHIDFGPDSLPHETGEPTMEQAVSFTKGCYLGQEVVARMQSLGHPKRILRGLIAPDDSLPVAGSQVAATDDHQQIIGAVTSSTISPLKGNRAIALAVLKWSSHEPGAKVAVSAEGAFVDVEVTTPAFVD